MQKNQTALIYAQSLGVNGYSQDDVAFLKELAHEKARSSRPKPEVKLDDIMGDVAKEKEEEGVKVKPCPKQCEENKRMVKIVFDIIAKEKDDLVERMNKTIADKQNAEVLLNELDIESNILQQKSSTLKEELLFI